MIAVRPCTTLDEVRNGLVILHYFGAEPSDDGMTRLTAASLVPERMHVAFDGDVAVGSAGAYVLPVSVPGGATVPAAGITVVGVLPTHRRQGVLTSLMRAQLDDVAARGEPLAWLWASEATIYGRFGYGMASFTSSMTLPRHFAQLVDAPEVPATLRLVTHAEAMAAFPPIYERVSSQRAGFAARSAAWWDKFRLADPPSRRGGAGPMQRMLVSIGGEPAGYALYRVKQSFDQAGTTGVVNVIEAVATTPDATLATWRVLLSFDWTSRIEAELLPVDHPLHLLLALPRRGAFHLGDGVFVRLVDVGAALSARAYQADDPVVFEVTDRFLPANQGRWRLAGGRATRTDASADLVLPVDALGSAYMSGLSFRRLAEIGRVAERVPGAIARADRVFGTWPAPWCPEVF